MHACMTATSTLQDKRKDSFYLFTGLPQPPLFNRLTFSLLIKSLFLLVHFLNYMVINNGQKEYKEIEIYFLWFSESLSLFFFLSHISAYMCVLS